MDKKIFNYEESAVLPGMYHIVADHEKFFLSYTEGSFNIICARLLNLSYANYLRFCRDVLGAKLVGKGSTYPVAYFKESAELKQLVRLLNARAELVLFERTNPDFETHRAVVEGNK